MKKWPKTTKKVNTQTSKATNKNRLKLQSDKQKQTETVKRQTETDKLQSDKQKQTETVKHVLYSRTTNLLAVGSLGPIVALGSQLVLFQLRKR
jgi:hypothetical protein